jgi:predicted nucleic acid-binding protein
MSTVYSFADISLLWDREFFVDANILVYRFVRLTGVVASRHARGYMKTYNVLVSGEYQLRTSFDVISEYINRAMRMHQNHLGFEGLDYKIFRDSASGRAALQQIHDTLRDDILKQVIIVERPYDNASVERLLVIDRLDFVDQSIVAICAGKSYVLFTADGDFRDSSVEVLTNNPVYFAA